MAFTIIATIVLCLASTLVTNTECLMCFQCADTTTNSPCFQDYQGLVNTSKGISDTYMKNCSDSNDRWDRCVIEEHIGSGGKPTLFKRGCHDGKYFNKNVKDAEFVNLTANNFTTCTRPGSELVCFTFCQTNYCNGPQPVKDPCSDYDSYNYNATLPPGIVCGSIGVNSFLSKQLIISISMLVLGIYFQRELC